MKGNIESIDKVDCSGCTACKAICPVGAIVMSVDQQGFKYPGIDHELCIDCGKCLSTCPAAVGPSRLPVQKAFAVKNRDKSEQLSSTSGGFSSALAQKTVTEKGAVYGVTLNDDLKVVTVRIDSDAELDTIKGSKYVQTDMRDTFKQAADDLKSGRKVLFTGSSCHIDGLKRFLSQSKIDDANLITVDYICHGVPSPQVFNDYISYISGRKPVKDFKFRTKKKGWGFGSGTFSPAIIYADNSEESDTRRARAYQQLFFSNCCLRPHCYECPYAGQGRVGDFTMADFWGLHEIAPQLFDKDGVSLVLVNTKQGAELIESDVNLEISEVDPADAAKYQTNMRQASLKSDKYDQFWNDMAAKSFDYVLRKYTSISLPTVIARRIKKIFK